jgi:pimeloyl-ACP methyl ester carboxylesterase
LDWPVDVVKLARHLGIHKKFTVYGGSGGGPYALACAYAIPERLKGVGVVAGTGPWQGFKTTEGMPWPRRIRRLFCKYGGEAAVRVERRNF